MQRCSPAVHGPDGREVTRRWRSGIISPRGHRGVQGGITPMAVAGSVSDRPLASEATRWGQLIFGIICMVMIANLQYGWTLFVNPIDEQHHWGRAAIQVAFPI